MSLSQIPGRSPAEQGDERIRGDNALADEIQRRGRIVTLEDVALTTVEARIPHGQTTTPVIIGFVPQDVTGLMCETRAPDSKWIYVRASSSNRSFRITLLVPDR